VFGSVRRAARGDSASEILKAYFPGLKIATAASLRQTPAPIAPPSTTIAAGEQVAAAGDSGNVEDSGKPGGSGANVESGGAKVESGGAKVPSVAGGAEAPPPQLSQQSRFVLVLPASAEAHRTAIDGVVTRSLEALRTATGQPIPPDLQVVFHPSPASFQRETGESWWSAARTRGARIDLQPPDVLRDRGTLEITIRHELAHVLTATVVADRAEWIKEGAAMHFAGEPPPQSLIGPDGIPRRVHCPSDADLQRPASAALARQAYGLAAACFERALVENGGKWDSVR
jgi:hypothetical protein